MPGRVTIEFLNGELVGRSWNYTTHDLCAFGRAFDCNAVMPESDLQVSRHHFILEVNPPEVSIRDLGSRNKTIINDVPSGGRQSGESAANWSSQRHPAVRLHDGDRIRIGRTELVIRIEQPVFCCRCVTEIPESDSQALRWVGNNFLCRSCRDHLPDSAMHKTPAAPRCGKCGQDVSAEIGIGQRGDYVCRSCRDKLKHAGAEGLKQTLQSAISRSQHLQFSDLKIGRKLGEGAFGAVYEAQTRNGVYAVKVMLSEVAVNPQAKQRFLREIEIGRNLCHPNIVSILDYGAEGSLFFFIMERSPGGSLQDLFEHHGGPLPLTRLAIWLRQVAEGMAHAHRQNFVHRDIKPSNVLLFGEEHSTAKVADFGLAKNFETAGLSGLTMTQQFAGTFAFMPPEQITNFKYSTPASDVYSLAATFYFLLTGHYPREFTPDRDPVSVVLDEQTLVPIRKRSGSIPAELAEILDRALNHVASQRFQTAGEFSRALR